MSLRASGAARERFTSRRSRAAASPYARAARLGRPLKRDGFRGQPLDGARAPQTLIPRPRIGAGSFAHGAATPSRSDFRCRRRIFARRRAITRARFRLALSAALL